MSAFIEIFLKIEFGLGLARSNGYFITVLLVDLLYAMFFLNQVPLDIARLSHFPFRVIGFDRQTLCLGR